MSKTFIIARKELIDYFSSIRYLVVLLTVTLLIGLSTYSTVRGLGESRISFLELLVRGRPTVITIMSYIASILGIALGFDAVNREKRDRTLILILSCPIYRDTLLTGKFISGAISIGITISLAIALACGNIMALTGIVPSQEELLRIAVFSILSFTYVLSYYAVSLLFSVIVDSASISLLLSMMFWVFNTYIVPSIAWTIASIISPESLEGFKVTSAWILMFSINQHYEATSVCLLNPRAAYRLLLTAPWSIPLKPLSFAETMSTVWPSIAVLCMVTVISIMLSYMKFLTKEIT